MASATVNSADPEEETYHRKSHVRYGANCPGVIELIFKDRKHYIALTGVIVNLSVTGCLFSNDKMPWANRDAQKSPDSLFDIISESCRIYIPWGNTHCAGTIRRVGSFIIGVEFHQPLKESLVAAIADLEPNQHLRFKPKRSRKYNRILPIAERLAEKLDSAGRGADAR